MKRPRVLHVITGLEAGGSARLVVDLVRALSGEVEGAIACGRDERGEASLRSYADRAGVRILDVPSLGRRASILADRRALRELGEVLRSFGPSVVHTHLPKAGVLGRMAAARAGVAGTVHTFHAPLGRLGRDGLLMKANAKAERQLAGSTGRLVAVSESLRRELVDAGIAPAARIQVVAPLIDPASLFAPAGPGVWRRRLNLSPQAPLISLVGRLTPAKDPETFIRTFAVVAGSLRDARGVVAGEGPLRPSLEKLALKLHVRDRITFTGWLDGVADLLADTDLLAVTSRSEGFPLPILEAMAAGRPVVATRVAGVLDLVDDGRTGLLASPGDVSALAGAWILLLHDAAYRGRLATAAREEAWQRFSGAGAARPMAALYAEMARGEGRGARAEAAGKRVRPERSSRLREP
ncbi:MAG: glycosyltransferase [Acidobacteria bacterium]|nr:glycosyltransferase [Acidobacteriota bacterium]